MESPLGHSSWTVGPFYFCASCGAHTRVSLKKLGQVCPGKATTPAMIHAIGLLKQGLHPTLGYFLGLLAPLAQGPMHQVPGMDEERPD